jgi:hypothetical protein
MNKGGIQVDSAELWRELAQTKAAAPKGTQGFVNWRHVDAGVVPWTHEGKSISCWNGPPASTSGPTGPVGIRLEAQKAKLIGPLCEMDQPWETNYNMYFATVLYEEGQYRAWYTCVPNDYTDSRTGKSRKAHGHIVCYAQSKDGYHWEKPDLGIYSYEGASSNIVYGRELGPYGFQSGSIFVDPHADPSEKYKMFFLGVIDHDEDMAAVRQKYAQRFGDAVSPKIFTEKNGAVSTKCMCAAVSADGIHWETIKEPILAVASDTLNTCYWDEGLGKYIAYIRLWKNGRRVVGRAESADFYLWKEAPRIVLEASLDWSPCMDVYTNSRVHYPGSDMRLMFPGVYDRYEDRRKVYMASSEDESTWNWVPGDCIADCGNAGQWNGGDLNPGTGMVFLDEKTVALPVMVSEEPHKYPRDSGRALGKLGWLTWEKGRLACIASDQSGAFTTTAMLCNGDELSLNLDTAIRTGQVLVELQDEKGCPIVGYTLAECDPICTSNLDHRVTWNGNASITRLRNQAIRIRFVMRIAKLYAFEFVDADCPVNY